MKRFCSFSVSRDIAKAVSAAALTVATLVFSVPASAETAAEAAAKPVQRPNPYRLPDGHLNWTGFWAPVRGMLQVNIGLGGSTPGVALPFTPPFSHFTALKSPYKERFDQLRKGMMAGKIIDPLAQCFPPGMPDMMIMIYGMELLQTPGQVTITSEWQAASRRIRFDLKDHTPFDELDPTYAAPAG